MKILVTGGTGFIGSHLCRKLTEMGHRVVCLDCLTYAADLKRIADLKTKDNFTFIKRSILSPTLLNHVFYDYGFEYVFALAAETHVDNSISSPEPFIDTNIKGTYNVLEACRKYKVPILYFSTDEVMGSTTPDNPFTEQSPINTSSVYSASKASGELLTQSYMRTYKLPAVIVRPSNNFGTFQHKEKLIPHFVDKLIRGHKVPVYGTGLQMRNWMWVEDCVDGAIAAMKALGQTYNLSSKVLVKNIDVTNYILEALGLGESYIDYVDDRPGHDFCYWVDSTRARTQLGWEPKIDNLGKFKEKLTETVLWYQENLK